MLFKLIRLIGARSLQKRRRSSDNGEHTFLHRYQNGWALPSRSKNIRLSAFWRRDCLCLLSCRVEAWLKSFGVNRRNGIWLFLSTSFTGDSIGKTISVLDSSYDEWKCDLVVWHVDNFDLLWNSVENLDGWWGEMHIRVVFRFCLSLNELGFWRSHNRRSMSFVSGFHLCPRTLVLHSWARVYALVKL